MDLERELNEITRPVEGTLNSDSWQLSWKGGKWNLDMFLLLWCRVWTRPQFSRLAKTEVPQITFLESNKGQVPASRYGETFVPRCTGWGVKAQAHTCQKEACLWPWAHNPHRRTSPRGELCVEAEKGEKVSVFTYLWYANQFFYKHP